MNSDEIEEQILDYVTRTFPNFTLETVSEIVYTVGCGWDWEEKSLPNMKNYIENKICDYSRKELINIDLDLYHEACENAKDKKDVMDYYCSRLSDKYECECWIGARYVKSEESCYDEETEDCYIWCD